MFVTMRLRCRVKALLAMTIGFLNACHYEARSAVVIPFIFTLLILPVFADNYNLYNSNDYSPNYSDEEKILFILDFSNSMNEYLEGRRKVDLMVETMKRILPQLNPNISVGLRVYGHRGGFTPIDACKASSLIEPIRSNNGINIRNSLYNLKPNGMTPITYSLKQSLKKDFIGFNGRKHIILLTDGGENCDESPCKYVMELVKIRKDVKIDVIAFNINDSDDLSQLECTSLVTSGKFYNAQTTAELLRSLNNSVNSVKKVEAKIIME